MGLSMPGERKNAEPIASVVPRARVSAKHQSLLHLVGAGRTIMRVKSGGMMLLRGGLTHGLAAGYL